MFKEGNAKTNLPAQIDLYATSQYDFQFIAKDMLLHRYLFKCLLCMHVQSYLYVCMYVVLAWSSVSRSGDRGAGAQNGSEDGHRGSVRGSNTSAMM